MREILHAAARVARANLGIVPTWSTLRTLGQSKLLLLTALIPFLGTLILFNQQFVDFLLLSPSIVGRWIGVTGSSAEEASRNMTLGRLQLTYFGLVFLGLGSFLFAISCPHEVKRNDGISEFIERERPLITRSRIGLLVTDVVADYLKNHGEEARGPELLRDLAYPLDLEGLFDSVITDVTENTNSSGTQTDSRLTSDWDDSLGIYTMLGNVNVDATARILYNSIRAHRVFWSSFHSHAEKYLTDFLALRYLALDHSKPALRIVVATSYAIGFTVLFLPTAHTFYLIVHRLVVP
jgi:hypothetical protein